MSSELSCNTHTLSWGQMSLGAVWQAIHKHWGGALCCSILSCGAHLLSHAHLQGAAHGLPLVYFPPLLIPEAEWVLLNPNLKSGIHADACACSPAGSGPWPPSRRPHSELQAPRPPQCACRKPEQTRTTDEAIKTRTTHELSRRNNLHRHTCTRRHLSLAVFCSAHHTPTHHLMQAHQIPCAWQGISHPMACQCQK